MLKYKILSIEITVSVDSADPNKSGKVAYEGDESAVKLLKHYLGLCYGAFGHVLNPEMTTPIDMDAALKSREISEIFGAAEIVEGGDLVKTYDPGIPDKCVT